jgi:hypothetical protein
MSIESFGFPAWAEDEGILRHWFTSSAFVFPGRKKYLTRVVAVFLKFIGAFFLMLKVINQGHQFASSALSRERPEPSKIELGPMNCPETGHFTDDRQLSRIQRFGSVQKVDGKYSRYSKG